MRKKKQESAPPVAPEWMVTFSDIISLLVTFFVLLITYSSIDSDKFELARGSMQGALGLMDSPRKRDQAGVKSKNALTLSKPVSHQHSEVPSTSEVEPKKKEARHPTSYNAGTPVDLDRTSLGVGFRLQTEIAFDPGSSDLLEKYLPTLKAIAQLLSQHTNRAVIRSFGDLHFSGSSQYPSNWHLASARSLRVWRYLVEVGQVPQQQLAIAAALADPSAQSVLRPPHNVEVIILRKDHAWPQPPPAQLPAIQQSKSHEPKK